MTTIDIAIIYTIGAIVTLLLLMAAWHADESGANRIGEVIVCTTIWPVTVLIVIGFLVSIARDRRKL